MNASPRRPVPRPRFRPEVEILEDRLPLSASPVAPLVAPLAAPAAPAPVFAIPLNQPANAPGVIPGILAGQGTGMNSAIPAGALGMFGPFGPGFVGTFTPGTTAPANATLVPGSHPATVFDPLGRASAFFSTVAGPSIAPTIANPFAGSQQESSAGAALPDKTRDISGIDSRVFDARTQDRMSLRDQREVRGLGDPSGLVLQPQQQQPVPPPMSPSLNPTIPN